MIYNYEGEFLKYMNRCFPEMKLMTYASDEDLLTGLDTVKKYPSMYYSRTNMNVEWNKTISIPPTLSCPYEFNLYPYTQEYVGTIIIENQKAAFNILSTLKYYWNSHPYIYVRVPGIYEKDDKTLTKVALRLLSISIEDMRLPNDKNGACRAIRFKWSSNLLLSNAPNTASNLVEKVVIGYRISEHDEEHGYEPLHADVEFEVTKNE